MSKSAFHANPLRWMCEGNCHFESQLCAITIYLHQPKKLVEANGFEPMTSCLQSRCSPNWATPPKKWWAWVDLNYRPHAYQACALTKLSYRPGPFKNHSARGHIFLTKCDGFLLDPIARSVSNKCPQLTGSQKGCEDGGPSRRYW